MLARAAENLYWMARYLERAENTARLINSTTHVLLDLPPGASFGWANLVEVAGLDELFEKKYPVATEEATMRFLIEDANNPSSICSCVQYARENTRGLREVLPAEMWERINTLYHFVREHAPGACRSRRERYLVLDAIIEKRHAIIGMVAGTMARDTAFHIIRLGRNVERADMTTRILDLNSAVRFPQDSVLHETLIERVWKSTLDSLSAYQSYRRLVNMHVRSDAVIGFLLQDMRFPRSVKHCLCEMESAFSLLPRSQQLQQLTARLRHKVAQHAADNIDAVALHEYLDMLQKELGEINDSLAANYFHAYQADLKQLIKGQVEIVFAEQ